jgi:hypothetical protein
MVANGRIATLPFHVAKLSFAEISKRPISLPAVFISVSTSRGAADREYQRVFRWRDDAALFLAAEFGMDVSAAIVRVPNLEAFDGHWLFRPLRIVEQITLVLVKDKKTCGSRHPE